MAERIPNHQVVKEAQGIHEKRRERRDRRERHAALLMRDKLRKRTLSPAGTN